MHNFLLPGGGTIGEDKKKDMAETFPTDQREWRRHTDTYTYAPKRLSYLFLGIKGSTSVKMLAIHLSVSAQNFPCKNHLA